MTTARRITPQDVVQAYQSTGLRPLFGKWEEDLTGGHHAGCALTTLRCASESWRPEASNTTWHYDGFVFGWDSVMVEVFDEYDFERIPQILRHHPEWEDGYKDGREAAMAVLAYQSWEILRWTTEEEREVVMLVPLA